VPQVRDCGMARKIFTLPVTTIKFLHIVIYEYSTEELRIRKQIIRQLSLPINRRDSNSFGNSVIETFTVQMMLRQFVCQRINGVEFGRGLISKLSR